MEAKAASGGILRRGALTAPAVSIPLGLPPWWCGSAMGLSGLVNSPLPPEKSGPSIF